MVCTTHECMNDRYDSLLHEGKETVIYAEWLYKYLIKVSKAMALLKNTPVDTQFRIYRFSRTKFQLNVTVKHRPQKLTDISNKK